MRLRRLAIAAALIMTQLVATSVARAVEGGTVDRSATHAVAIARGSATQANVTCSGTLISANVVLTVRHCIASLIPRKDGAPPCDARLGPVEIEGLDTWVNVSPWTDAGARWKKVKSATVPESTELCGDDIALLILEEPVAESEAVPARPIVDEASFLRAASDRRIGLAAFGVTGVGASDVGTRRSRYDIPIGCVPSQPGFLCGPELDFIGTRELTTGSGPCRGDSGGGAMTASDTSVILGVLSRGDRGVDGATCALGVFERTDVWAWLIARTVIDAASPSSPAPSWATVLFPANPKTGELCESSSSTACGPGAQCASIDGRRSWTCAARCTTDGRCGAGQQCVQGICIASKEQEVVPEQGSCSTATATRSESSQGLFALLLIVVTTAVAMTRRVRSIAK